MIHYNSPNNSGKGNKKQYILLHHTATKAGTAKGVINGRMKTSGLSCHYLVDELGQVYSFNSEDHILYHAGAGQLGPIKDTMNNYAIGIEVLGPLGDGQDFSDVQRKTVALLIQDIAKRNNIKIENVVRHKDYTSRKVDIYDSFWNSTHKTRESYRQSLFLNGEKPKSAIKTEKQIQASKVTEENGKLWNLTDSQENKNKIHEYSDRIRKTFEI